MSYSLRNPIVSFIKILDLTQASLCHKNLIYIDKNNLIIDIPKSGSSFIKSNLIYNNRSLLSINENFPWSAIFKRPLKTNDALDKVDNIYAFIKDPIDRFCSVYREKVMNHKFSRKKWSPKANNLNIFNSKENSIDNILKFISHSNYNQIDKHLLPQFKFIEPYLDNNKLKIYPIKKLTDFANIFFDKNLFFESCLKTDKNLFDRDNISKKNIKLLKEFYKDDFKLIKDYSL